MAYLEERVAERIDIPALNNFALLGGVAVLLPFFIHQQWLTGPMVNAILILALFLSGLRASLLLCLIPSLVALASGLLPAVLAPVVPFIMLSNVLFVLTLDFFYNSLANAKQGYWLGLLAGSFLKFIFLFVTSGLVAKLLIKQELVGKVFQMRSWPQFSTAFLGGIIAWGFLKWLKRI